MSCSSPSCLTVEHERVAADRDLRDLEVSGRVGEGEEVVRPDAAHHDLYLRAGHWVIRDAVDDAAANECPWVESWALARVAMVAPPTRRLVTTMNTRFIPPSRARASPGRLLLGDRAWPERDYEPVLIQVCVRARVSGRVLVEFQRKNRSAGRGPRPYLSPFTSYEWSCRCLCS